MKTRNGFVSNSSSSSFIVAFTKKPKSVDDVMEMLFDNDVNGKVQPYDFCDGTENQKVAERVFFDVNTNKRAKKSDVASEFEGRYFVFYNESKPYYPPSEYCSTDNEIIQEERKKKLIEDDYNERLDSLKKDAGIVEVPYAYDGGSKWVGKTQVPYTTEDILKYKDFCKRNEKFCKTNEEYVRLQKECWDVSNKNYSRINALRLKLGMIDATKFFDDNKGKYITKLNYGDEDGDGNMEHGDIFQKLNHVRISHH